MQKSTLSLTSFLRYCKEIADLLFLVICACLAIYTLNEETFDVYLQEKNQIHSSRFP